MNPKLLLERLRILADNTSPADACLDVPTSTRRGAVWHAAYQKLPPWGSSGPEVVPVYPGDIYDLLREFDRLHAEIDRLGVIVSGH